MSDGVYWVGGVRPNPYQILLNEQYEPASSSIGDKVFRWANASYPVEKADSSLTSVEQKGGFESFKKVEHGSAKVNEPAFDLVSYRIEFSQVSKNDYLEYGEVSATDRLVEKWYEALPKQKFYDVISHLLANLPAESNELIFLFKAISNIPSAALGDFGVIAVASGLVDKNIEIKDAALRVYEKWGSKASLPYLNRIQVEPAWLDDYRKDIIQYLESL